MKKVIGTIAVWQTAVLMTLCFLISTVMAGESSRIITNGDGTQLRVPAKVTRVAALWGPAYEKIAMLGAEDKIVGCSRSHQVLWPWANVVFKNVDNVTAVSISVPSFEVNMEELIKINPDVVFNWSFPQSVQKINNAGYPAVIPANKQDVGYVKDILMVYASALGEKEIERARQYADYFDNRLAMVTSRTGQIPEEKRPRVFFAMGDPLKCDGSASPLPKYIELAGGNCVHKNIPGNFGQRITMEQLALWNPEFIFIDMAGAAFYGKKKPNELLASISNDPKFQTISAIKNGNVYTSPTGVFFWSAGQQVILQVMWMAKKFHPELFSDLDMESEVKQFYSTFFDYNLSDEQTRKLLAAERP